MDKKKLKGGNWDPIFKSSFGDLRKMSKTAFILRLLYRSYRNPRTNLCDLSDAKIREITGWRRETIQFAREELLKKRLLAPRGYHLFYVPKLSTSRRKIRQPHLTENPSRDDGKSVNHLTENPSRDDGKSVNFPHPSDTDIQTTEAVVDVLNPPPPNKPLSLPELVELHFSISHAQPNEGLRRAVLNHLNNCFISGWKLTEIEAKVRNNSVNYKKTIYQLIQPLTADEQRLRKNAVFMAKEKDLKDKGFVCENCEIFITGTQECGMRNIYRYRTCGAVEKFKPIKKEP